MGLSISQHRHRDGRGRRTDVDRMEAAMCGADLGDDGGPGAAEPLLGRWLLLSYLGRL